MIMKYITLLLLALAVAFGAKAQNADEFWYSIDWQQDAENILETDAGDLLIVSDVYGIDGNMKYLILYEFTKDGHLIDSLVSDKISYSCFLLEKDPNPDDDCAYLFGFAYYENDESIFRLMKLDDYLQTVEQFGISYCQGESENETYLLDSNNDIILYWRSTDKMNHFVRIGLDGAILTENTSDSYSDNCLIMRESLSVYNENPLQYAMAYMLNVSMSPSICHIVTLYDSVFNVISTRELEEIGNLYLDPSQPLCVKAYGGKHYLSCNASKTSGTQKRISLLAEIDDDFNVIGEFCHSDDRHNQLGWNPFVQAADGGFYFCYRYPSSPAPMTVSKLDQNLNLEWTRWCAEPFNGSTHPCCSDMWPLANGGIVLSGMELDYGVSRVERFWVAIFSSEGTGTPETEQHIRPYIIYPNPMKDRLSIHFSPDVKPESIELYDVSGHCVASSRTAEMDVANLPAGQYVAKITLEGGKVYSDKLVKK